MTGSECSRTGCGRTGKLTRGMCARCYRYWLDHTPRDQRGTPPRFVDDFWERVEKTHEHGCWLWRGQADRQGYGRWKRYLAHRESWRRSNGEIPDGKWVLHHCDNPPCVNPAHLYLGTVVENVRDMVTRGRAHVPPLKTRCDSGHLIEGDNLRETVSDTGAVRRRCRICDNARRSANMRKVRHARGLLKTKLSGDEKARILDLRREGMSHRKISAEVGRSLMVVQRTLKEGGL